MKTVALTLCAVAGLAAPAMAQVTLGPLSTFGAGATTGVATPGWRQPYQVLTGDSLGSNDSAATPSYRYLGAVTNAIVPGVQFGGANLERGLAYNPVSGNLILVSRSNVGGGLRVLDGSTGADKGQLNQGSGVISGGTFTTSLVSVGDDGAIYVSNLQTNVSTGALKVYRWSDDSFTGANVVGNATPTTWFNSTIAGFTGTPRLGDSLDATGSGANTRLVLGSNGTQGYATITGPAAGGTATGYGAVSGTASGDFRLGITFAGSSNDVWGKVAATGSLLRRTVISAGTASGVGSGNPLTVGGESAMDYAVVGGVPVLAVLDMNSSILRIYDVTDPANPSLLISGTNTSGTLSANGNAAGSVKFGAINGNLATIYAMSTNQGIQAFSFQVPMPSAAGLLGLGGLVALRRRR